MNPLVARGPERTDLAFPTMALTRDRDGAPAAITQEAALRAAGASGLTAIALIHFMDFFSKLHETFYLAMLYLGLIAACLALAVALISGRRLGYTWMATATVAAVTALGYVASRSVGLPAATGDIGNWQEPLGLASLFVESVVVVMAGWALSVRASLSPAGSRRHPPW
jgi:multisubunit Na+/H+ antiporter MnhG subunit